MTEAAADALAGLNGYFSDRPAEVAARLDLFVALLTKWQPAQNLVSRETLDEVWTRHIRDSLQLLPHLPADCHRVLDIGSGGGFPALPLAIALTGRDINFVLIEANKRKCSFLRTVARELDLPVKVLDMRVETADVAGIPIPDAITCRATAPLQLLLPWIAPFAGPGTRLLLHKGREHGEEWREAAAHWSADVLVLPSLTDPHGVVLDIRHLKRKSA